MIVYLLILTLHASFTPMLAPSEFRDVAPDTLLDGTLAYRQALVVSSPEQAAVKLLERNRYLMPGNERWAGELFRVDVEGDRRVVPVRLPQIYAASNTLNMKVED